MHYQLKLKLNLTSAAFRLVRNRMHMRFRKKMICSHELPSCVAIYCVGMGRQSHHVSLTKVQRVLKKEKTISLNDAQKGYLKTWDQ